MLLLRLVRRSAWSDSPRDREAARSDFSLREGEHAISLWQYSGDAARLVIAAIGASRGQGKSIDYVLLDEAEAGRFGVLVQTPGNSPLSKANHLHWALQAGADDLVALADYLFDEGVQAERIQWKEVKAILRDADPAEFHPSCKDLLERCARS